MEFSSRGFSRNNNQRPAQPSGASFGGDSTPPSGDKSSFQQKVASKVRDNKLLSTLALVLSVSLLILFLATVVGISVGGGSREAASIDKDNYQVVALADGQAYFGKITGINSKNIVLQDVFYLNNSSDSAAQNQNNIQLIKRGCEVHSPQDRMIIYREQVNFWENLKTDGRVADAIAQWKEQNPDGQKCENQATTPTQQNTTTPTGTESNSSAPASDSTSPTAGDTSTDTTPSDTPTEGPSTSTDDSASSDPATGSTRP